MGEIARGFSVAAIAWTIAWVSALFAGAWRNGASIGPTAGVPIAKSGEPAAAKKARTPSATQG